MGIVNAFKSAFNQQKYKGWDYIYVAIDVHDTIFKASYKKHDDCEFFKYAKRSLQLMTINPNIKLILWTASYPEAIERYLSVFEDNGIHFDYVNENPEVVNTDLASFQDKMYFNVGIDDKFGFEPEIDWYILHGYVLGKMIER